MAINCWLECIHTFAKQPTGCCCRWCMPQRDADNNHNKITWATILTFSFCCCDFDIFGIKMKIHKIKTNTRRLSSAAMRAQLLAVYMCEWYDGLSAAAFWNRFHKMYSFCRQLTLVKICNISCALFWSPQKSFPNDLKVVVGM